jgi:hypothetical protein
MGAGLEPPDKARSQSDHRRLGLLRVHQVAFTLIGVATIGLTVILGIVIGVSICQVCNTGLSCHGATAPCGFSIIGQSLIIALLIVESVVVSIGLSSRAVARVTLRLGVYGIGNRLRVEPDVRTRTIALFLGPFSISLMILGLLLPFSQAGCIEPCVFQWNLAGYPTMLVGAGALLCAVSAALLLRGSTAGRQNVASRLA